MLPHRLRNTAYGPIKPVRHRIFNPMPFRIGSNILYKNSRPFDKGRRMLFLVSNLDIVHWRRYRPDLFAFFFPMGRKIMELPPSSWRQADVHRTSVFRSSNLSVLFHQKEKAHRMVCFFFLEVPARFELANESFAGSLFPLIFSVKS